MQALRDAFGKEIWKYVFLVFTFSNLARDGLKKKGKEHEYKKSIEAYVGCFQEQLKKMSVRDVTVKSIFGLQSGEREDSTIIAIPAGDDDTDDVLLDFKAGPTTITAGNVEANINIKDWRDVVFIEMIKKSKNGLCLLKYKYNPLFVMASAVAAGGAAGGVTGGMFGGPAGAIAGGVVGAGATVGGFLIAKK